jgi:hypothetical protein
MDRDSVERLRFDRRLHRRRDWVEQDAHDAYLTTLPDVSEKMTRGLADPGQSVGEDAPPRVADATVDAPLGSDPRAATGPAGVFSNDPADVP